MSFSFCVLTSCIINVVFSLPYSCITCLIYPLLLAMSTLLCLSPLTPLLTQDHFAASVLPSPSYRFSFSTLEEWRLYEVCHTAFVFASFGPVQWLATLFLSSEAFFFFFFACYCSVLYLKEPGLVNTGTNHPFSECNLSFAIRNWMY